MPTPLEEAVADLKAKLIDNGHYEISPVTAKRLNNGRFPRPGHEALVAHKGAHMWLATTNHMGKLVWSVRPSGGWRLINGQAVLGQKGIEEENKDRVFPLKVEPR